VTLSHAIEETPNTINNVLTQLNSVIKTKLEQAQAGAEFEQAPWFPRSSVGTHTPLHTYLRYAFPRGAWERENIDPGCHH